MPNRSLIWPVITTVAGGFLLITALPNNWKPFLPSFLQPTLHLGLDLQGGTQLDFRISEAEMEKQIEQLSSEIEELEQTGRGAFGGPAPTEDQIAEKKAQIGNIRFQRRNVVEAIRTVLERRVNSLGVSEAVITPSYYGAEKHLLVECPGVVNIQECIATVGKTILLEFKEQFTGEDTEHIGKMRALAEKARARMTPATDSTDSTDSTGSPQAGSPQAGLPQAGLPQAGSGQAESGETLKTVGEDLDPTLGVTYAEVDFFRSDLPEALADIWKHTSADPAVFTEVSFGAIPTDGAPTDLEPREPVENRGIIIAEVIGEKKETERVFQNPIEAMEWLAESNDRLTLKRHRGEDPDDIDDEHREALNAPGADPLDLGVRAGTLVTAGSSGGTLSVLFVTEYSEERGEIEASHILIAYEGAVRADPTITRTREEARELASELRRRLTEGADFDSIVREHSDGPSGGEGGSLGRFGRGEMSNAFEETAFALGKKGDISDPVETEFGFHIIRLDEEPVIVPGAISYLELIAEGDGADALQRETFEALRDRTASRTEEQIPLRTLFFSFIPTGWKDTPLDGKHFRRATVTTDPLTGIPVVQIAFDSEGGKLFHDLTKRNVGKPVAIFVGGELISAPIVQSEIPGGTAIITGSRNFEEANLLAQDLNTGAIPAPVHLVGQVTVEATLGEVALKRSIQAALLGFLLVSIYMIWYYRVLGAVAAAALLVYIVILTALLKLPLFFFTSQYVVLTLAGVAGVILSIGMAVDANVLIFERMKEELRKGKLLETAANTGFKRAWTSIWDSNVSTLLTAAILFVIGTSIVRGFAVTLSIGIFISMFTAVVVSRFLIRLLYKSPISENLAAFGVEAQRTNPPTPPH